MWHYDPSNFDVVFVVEATEEDDTPECVEQYHAEGHGCTGHEEVLRASIES